MKKQIAAALALALMLLTFTACGSSAASAAASSADSSAASAASDENAFAAYDAKGYTHGATSTEGENPVLHIYFTAADKTDCVRVEAALTTEQKEELDALDFFSDDFFDKQWEIITSLPADEITVIELADQIPSEETMQSYKTIGDLVNDGYEYYMDEQDENEDYVMVYYSYDTCIEYAVTPADEDVNYWALSDEQINALELGSIRFWGMEA